MKGENKMSQTFIEECLSGNASLEEIDDYISMWHEDENNELELHEYLGLTLEEYSLWVENPSFLKLILLLKQGNKI